MLKIIIFGLIFVNYCIKLVKRGINCAIVGTELCNRWHRVVQSLAQSYAIVSTELCKRL